MFSKSLFLIAISFQLTYAQSLVDILELVEKNNTTLKAQESQIQSSEIDAKLSNTWTNPVLGLGVTDINIDEPTSRDIEAMQTQYITYSQSLPTNGKLKLAHEIKKYDTSIYQLQYDNYKQKLKSEALLYSYNIYFDDKKLMILHKYIENLEQQKELMNLLYENGKLNQSSLVQIDIKMYQLKLKVQKLLYISSKMKSDLENIIFTKVNTIELDGFLKNATINTKNVIENHPLIQIQKVKIKQQIEKINLENSKKIADIKFTVGYYQRKKFDDYVSLNVAIPLSIQGIEKLKVKKSTVEKSTIENNLKSLEQKLKTTLEDLTNQIELSKKNFQLIDERMIPLNGNLEQSHKMHISANTMQSIEVYESTNSKYELMLLSINEKINYFNAVSKLYYFKGEL